MAKYKTYLWQKWLCRVGALFAYFAPMIIATFIFLPVMQIGTAAKIGIGFILILLRCATFALGLVRNVLAHVPMLDGVPFVYFILQAFFTLPNFKAYIDKFNWIFLAAIIGEIVGIWLWHLANKYSKANETVKTVVKSGLLGA